MKLSSHARVHLARTLVIAVSLAGSGGLIGCHDHHEDDRNHFDDQYHHDDHHDDDHGDHHDDGGDHHDHY